MKFRYEGHDKAGKPMRGDVEAPTKEEAAQKLRDDDVYVIGLEEEGSPRKDVLDHGDLEEDIEAMKAEDEPGRPPRKGSEKRHLPEERFISPNPPVPGTEKPEPKPEPELTWRRELRKDLDAIHEIQVALRGGREGDVTVNDDVLNEVVAEMVKRAAMRAFERVRA